MKTDELIARHFGIEIGEITDAHRQKWHEIEIDCQRNSAAKGWAAMHAGVDPEEGREERAQRHDRLSRIKALPELERAILEPNEAGDTDHADLAKTWDELYLLSAIKFGTTKQGDINVPARGVKNLDYWQRLEEELPHVAKAISTATAGSGLEWAPTAYSANMLEAVRHNLNVTNLFPSMPMTGKSMVLPFALTGGSAYLQGESTSDDPAMYATTTGTTADRTATAKKCVANQIVSDEADEDAIVSCIPQIQEYGARLLAEQIEMAVLNGDTTASHMDSDVTSPIDFRRAWDGLRHQALVTANGANKSLATFGGDTVLSLFTAMDQQYVQNPADCVIIIPSKLRAKWLTMVTNSTDKLPVYQPATARGDTTLATGAIADFYGTPVVMTGYMDLSDSSGYDTGSGTAGSCLVTSRRAWQLMVRKDISIEVERVARKGISYVISTWRGDFLRTAPATDLHTALGYNIGL